jgi:hypothetical protein
VEDTAWLGPFILKKNALPVMEKGQLFLIARNVMEKEPFEDRMETGKNAPNVSTKTVSPAEDDQSGDTALIELMVALRYILLLLCCILIADIAAGVLEDAREQFWSVGPFSEGVALPL